jgi:hypothetical protein
VALREVTAIRYVTPLREGGSLPGLMEADDLGTYAVKFRGAGQGPPVLVAEVVAGELARALGLPVPELVVVDLDPALGAAEPDQEVQELLRASPGANLGTDFLPGALDLDPGAFAVDPGFAGRVLWFDALIGNVDRSWRNTNMLFWHGRPYLIDHGASLTFHHHWPGADAWVGRPYAAADHVLLPATPGGAAPDLDAADAALAPLVTPALLGAVVDLVPETWLVPGPDAPTDLRGAYAQLLLARVEGRATWLPGLRTAVAEAAAHPPHRPDDPLARLRRGRAGA